MKRLGKTFYILLGILTAAVLGLLFAFFYTKKDLFLYLTLGVFVLYLFHLVYHLVKSGRTIKKRDELLSSLVVLLGSEEAEVVYVTYLGGERGALRPSKTKKDYLVEVYRRAVDISLLKKHLWFDLPEEEEKKLSKQLVGSVEIPYPFLEKISKKTVLIQEGFYDVVKDSPLFAKFFSENKIVLYGETQ